MSYEKRICLLPVAKGGVPSTKPESPPLERKKYNISGTVKKVNFRANVLILHVSTASIMSC